MRRKAERLKESLAIVQAVLGIKRKDLKEE